MRKNQVTLILCVAVIISIALNIVLFDQRQAAELSTGPVTELNRQPAGKTGEATLHDASSEVNNQILASLQLLHESINELSDELNGLRSQGLTHSGGAASPPSEAELARREAKNQRMRERFMVDLPEDQRAVALHQRWLENNQDKMATADLDIQRLDRIRLASLSQKQSRD